MRVVFTSQGWADDLFWQEADRHTLRRIHRLIDDALRDPTSGIGKPEPVTYGISGAWSRRITEERRVVDQVRADDVIILAARYHDEK